jgi:hypothetical protein
MPEITNKIVYLMLFSMFSVMACSSVSTDTSSSFAPQTTYAATINKESKPDTTQNSASTPTNTVREFYKALREQRFKDAMLMTNLSPAVDGLTPQEMEELKSDFEPLAERVPETIDVSGEQISGNLATVFIRLADETTGIPTIDEIKLRKDNDKWVLLTGDPQTESQAKREGKNYFFNLRMNVHHDEAQELIRKIVEAELAFALQNNGLCGELADLVKLKLVPENIENGLSIGYRFRVTLSKDKTKFSVNAEPTQYGRTGKLSFWIEGNAAGKTSPLKSEDRKGAPIGK